MEIFISPSLMYIFDRRETSRLGWFQFDAHVSNISLWRRKKNGGSNEYFVGRSQYWRKQTCRLFRLCSCKLRRRSNYIVQGPRCWNRHFISRTERYSDILKWKKKCLVNFLNNPKFNSHGIWTNFIDTYCDEFKKIYIFVKSYDFALILFL